MHVQPANIDQIRAAADGRMVLISADVGGVAKQLREIDPGLRVAFAERGNPPFWRVFWESEDRRETYLVTTVQAVQNRSGTWEGLDQRLVETIKSIDPRGGYDYATALQTAERERREKAHREFRERTGPYGERLAWALRKDLGIKDRAFIR